MLMEMSGEAQQSAVIRLTSQQLARMAHCSRQSLYEAVKTLTALGAVQQKYGQIEIIDQQRLRAAYQGSAVTTKG
jgi:DNA-binding FadR family transcriptional regulator